MPSVTGIVASSNRAAPAWATAWRTAYDAAAVGGGQAHVACLGDSVTQGYYTDSPYYINSWVGQVTAALATTTGQATGTGVIWLEDEFVITEPRITAAGTWTNSTPSGFMGKCRIGNSATDIITVGPIDASSFRMMAIHGNGLGSYEYRVDGGSWTTVNTASAVFAPVWTSVSAGSPGSHTLEFQWKSGNVFMGAVEVLYNTTSGVKVSRIGASNEQTSTAVAQAFGSSARYCNLTLDPDLTIISFGLNEAYYGTSVATFETNMTTLITDMQSLGSSVLILAAPPPNTTWISGATWNSFRTSMAGLAATNGCGFLDMADYWTSYAASSSYYHDNVHPNAAGHAAMGATVADFIINAVT